MPDNTNGAPWTPNQGNQGTGGQSFDPTMIGTGEGESPLAKPSEKIDMRTMASDIASMRETGGGAPRPYAPQNAPAKAAPSQPAAAKVPAAPPANMATKAMDVPPIPPSSSTPTTPGPVPEKPKPSKKGPFIGLLVLILVVGLAAVVYFFIYPMFKVSAPAVPSENAQPAVSTTAPAAGAPESTGAPTSTPVMEGTVSSTAPAASSSVSVLTVELHASFFKNPADLVFDTKLSSFGAGDLKAPLQFSPTSVPLLREIVWKTADNKPLAFAQVAGTFFPTFFTPQFTDNFQPDFTMFSYTDASGTWLGFVAQLKAGVDLGAVQGAMSPLQKSPDLAGFYLTDPGTQGVWKDGKILGHPASVVPFSTDGATFGYAWFDRYLIVSSNLNAATEAAHRLGY